MVHTIVHIRLLHVLGTHTRRMRRRPYLPPPYMYNTLSELSISKSYYYETVSCTVAGRNLNS